jgi:hypothetical protein
VSNLTSGRSSAEHISSTPQEFDADFVFCGIEEIPLLRFQIRQARTRLRPSQLDRMGSDAVCSEQKSAIFP